IRSISLRQRRSSHSKRSCVKSTRLRQLFGPNVAVLIRSYYSASDAKKKCRRPNTIINLSSNRSHSVPTKFSRATVLSDLQIACRRAWFAQKASSACPMRRSFSISSPAAGTWNRLKRNERSWCLSERKLLRTKRQFSTRWMNARVEMTKHECQRNDEARIIVGRFCETPWRLTQTPYNLSFRLDSPFVIRISPLFAHALPLSRRHRHCGHRV